MSKKTLYILRKQRGEQRKGCLPLAMRMKMTSSMTRLRPTAPRVRRTRRRGVTGIPRTRSAGPTPATWQHCTRRTSWITPMRARSVPWCLTQVKEDTLKNTDQSTFSTLMSDTGKGDTLNKTEESTLSSLISDTVFCPSTFLSDSPNFSPCPLQFSMKQLEGQLKVKGFSLVSLKVKVIHNGSHLEIILFPMNTCFLLF